ncbi:DUF6624 domain-containing protein [Altererythrobacter sp. Root672]|uniref:DUF6624 domain-containing protein n=1 Tax=Altererythrobacter sp. Root672 TaxID=1736584 RepID=UPI000A7E0B81|nr:DUF6624 domain-containing protein [Altererythrobacter sp. Root672]
MGLFFALSPLVLAVGTPASMPCAPIPGWEQVVAKQEVRWIVIGEIHGTNEIPAAFVDAVCLTSITRPLVVALEQSSSDQVAIDEFIRSDGSAEATQRFRSAAMWNMPIKDGRSSEAYFRLFRTLRQMSSEGRIISVVAFQPSAFSERPTPAKYEEAMAELLKGAAAGDATVIALVGNLHAMLDETPWEPKYLAMAAHLPREATVTLNTVSDGGETWTCQGQPIKCGPYLTAPNGITRSRRVELGSDDSSYSGVFYLGTSTTASSAEISPPPALIAEPASETDDPEQTRITAIVRPVAEAIAAEQARQSHLPPPASIREQLERMGRLDQVGRHAIVKIDFGRLSIEDRRRVNAAIGDAIEPIDQANVEALLEIMPEEGWFTISEFGPEASEAAFHIVQHSDLALRKRVLPRLEPLAKSGDIDGSDYASMFDRVAIGEGRPQRYGTQFRCRDGRQESYPIEDIGQAEELRRSLNFQQSLAESLAMQVGRPCGGGN